MILQPASRKELKRIAIGSALCAVLQVGVFWLLAFFEIGTFDISIILGTLGGTVMAIVNFALMCITIQNATGIEDEKVMKAKIRNGYNLRKILQILWVIVAFLLSKVNVLAAAIPLFFPNIVIYYLQFKGKLFPAEESAPRPAAAPEGTEEEGEDNLGPFEA